MKQMVLFSMILFVMDSAIAQLDKFVGIWNGRLDSNQVIQLRIYKPNPSIVAGITVNGSVDTLDYLGYKSSIDGIYFWRKGDLACICLFPIDTVTFRLAYFEAENVRKAKLSKPGTSYVGETRLANPESFKLFQNYPNPFNPETMIEFQISRREHVTVSVYDNAGRQIRNLLSEEKFAGDYHTKWDGRDDSGNAVSAGSYFIRFTTDRTSQTLKAVLLK